MPARICTRDKAVHTRFSHFGIENESEIPFDRKSVKCERRISCAPLSLSPAEYFIACNRSSRSTRCTAHVSGDINLLTDLMVEMRHLRTIFRLNYGRNRTSGAVAVSASAEERASAKKAEEIHSPYFTEPRCVSCAPSCPSNDIFDCTVRYQLPRTAKRRRRRENRTRIEASESRCAKLRNIQLAMRRFQWQIKQRANAEQHSLAEERERARSRAEAKSIRQCVRVVDSVLSIHRIRSDT